MAAIKKFNNMSKEQQDLYLQLTDVVKKWANLTHNNNAAGLQLMHEVCVAFTMAIAAFAILTKGSKEGGKSNENGAQAGTGNASVHPSGTEPSGTDSK